MPEAWEHFLPPRYHEPWRDGFEARARGLLFSGGAILDIGAGRNPTIPIADRPANVTYVGLDLSEAELSAAGQGAYSEGVVADASAWRPELADRFDIALSWQVLEHVPSLSAAVEYTRRYLKPGGTFLALFSGGLAAYAVANRILPNRLGSALVTRMMDRSDANPVFPAYYDSCTYGGIVRAFAAWSQTEITPLYRGAGYFRHFRSVLAAYLAYENAAARRWPNLATHYLVVAKR